MTAKDLKSSIHQLVEEVQDDTVLEAYHEILQQLIKVQQSSQVIGYHADGSPITRETLDSEISEARDRIGKGISIAHDDLRKQLDGW